MIVPHSNVARLALPISMVLISLGSVMSGVEASSLQGRSFSGLQLGASLKKVEPSVQQAKQQQSSEACELTAEQKAREAVLDRLARLEGAASRQTGKLAAVRQEL